MRFPVLILSLCLAAFVSRDGWGKTLCAWLVQRARNPRFIAATYARFGEESEAALVRGLTRALLQRLLSKGPTETDPLNPYPSYLIDDQMPGRFLFAPRLGARSRDPRIIQRDEVRFMVRLPENSEETLWSLLSEEGREAFAIRLARAYKRGCYDTRLTMGAAPEGRRLLRQAYGNVEITDPSSGIMGVGFSWARVLRGALHGQLIGPCRLPNSGLIAALLSLGAPPQNLMLVRRQRANGTGPRHLVAWVRGGENRPWIKLDATPNRRHPLLLTVPTVIQTDAVEGNSDDLDELRSVDIEYIPIVVSP